jgi:CheY-like chemotaxis protein
VKRTLVVDDIRTFDHVDDFADRTFVYAKNSRDAIALLERETFDSIWLDYNLAWNNADRDDNGLRVARWLRVHAKRNGAREVWIITDLDRYAGEMEHCLRNAYVTLDVTVTDIGHRWNELWR